MAARPADDPEIDQKMREASRVESTDKNYERAAVLYRSLADTAKNEALLENVLVMIVCILTRIPLFLIGASGSSKSLAIHLISSNLRGSDSNDEYFRNLPRVCLVPYQGSSSSTSDGIIKVFDKAKKFQKTSSKQFPVISVVLLDAGNVYLSYFVCDVL